MIKKKSNKHNILGNNNIYHMQGEEYPQESVFHVTPLTPVSINNRKKGYVTSMVGNDNDAHLLMKKIGASSVNTEKIQV